MAYANFSKKIEEQKEKAKRLIEKHKKSMTKLKREIKKTKEKEKKETERKLIKIVDYLIENNLLTINVFDFSLFIGVITENFSKEKIKYFKEKGEQTLEEFLKKEEEKRLKKKVETKESDNNE